MIRRFVLLVGLALLALPLVQAFQSADIAPGALTETLFRVSLPVLAIWMIMEIWHTISGMWKK